MCHTNLLKGTNFRKKDNGSIHIHIYFCLIFQHLILWKFVDSHIYLLALKEDSGALSEMASHYHNIHWGTHFNTLIFSPPSVHNKCSESCCAVILCTGRLECGHFRGIHIIDNTDQQPLIARYNCIHCAHHHWRFCSMATNIQDKFE